ncbi:MAG: substrate-binding domain-containing protein [Hespellia sp.]|nr:substrate-binding domain-containing protein [Hespellia sp.]
MKKKWKEKLGIKGAMFVLAFILLLLCCFAVYAFYHAIHAVNLGQTEGMKKYDYHFVMIHSGVGDDFWETLYKGAKEEGEGIGAYVEDFGDTVPGNYSAEDLMDMAIAAKVDGIIVEGNQSDEMRALIEEAEEQNITVVTMIHDVAGSERKAYVGINAYSLGELYGNQVVEALEKKKESAKPAENAEKPRVVVLVDTSEKDTSSSLIFASIREKMNQSGNDVEVTSLNIEKNEDFESEEIIRNLVLNKTQRPDVVVNLSSVDTISCSQAVIDYNLVGKIVVLGYYSAPEVLDGIEKGVIQASVDVDAEKIGKTCVEYLNKFIIKGYVSEYAAIDIRLITADNVEEYLEMAKKEQRDKGE